jgi:hypothetical protein
MCAAQRNATIRGSKKTVSFPSLSNIYQNSEENWPCGCESVAFPGVSSSDNHPPVLSLKNWLKNWSPRVRGLGISDASWRAIAFAIVAMALGGCMQETLAPTTQAGWSVRDKALMSNLPYAQATIPEEYRRHIVSYTRREAPAPSSSILAADFFITFYLRARRSAMALPLAKMRKRGAASPRLAARRNGRRGHRPPANTRGLGLSRPS